MKKNKFFPGDTSPVSSATPPESKDVVQINGQWNIPVSFPEDGPREIKVIWKPMKGYPISIEEFWGVDEL